ncbi:hypothetical protein [Massilia horti]|uniref:Uncharacterized protein n=1 Tax=Massilia horti TaxID=2562153 RepID=A0A4Y9T660_9BURK|nr:hypothetical protein [Massilia horti]TFW35985.1 hypothetical protein E4O92_00725 [Massilia horti]
MRFFPVRATLAILLALAAPVVLGAQSGSSQKTSDLTTVGSLSELPVDILDELGGVAAIADIGGNFNPTCVSQPGVPNSRLVRAAISPKLAQITVEHGGIVRYVETLEFRKRAGKWKLAQQANEAGR